MVLIAQAAGIALVLLTEADVFFSVLYPASGRGPLRKPLTRAAWSALRRAASMLSERRRRDVLAYSGPLVITATLLTWGGVLVVVTYLPSVYGGVTARKTSASALHDLDHVAFSGKIHAAKPEPAAFHRPVTALRAAPEDFLFVDDREENVRAARALGMHGHIFTTLPYLAPAINHWPSTSS